MAASEKPAIISTEFIAQECEAVTEGHNGKANIEVTDGQPCVARAPGQRAQPGGGAVDPTDSPEGIATVAAGFREMLSFLRSLLE